jgi:hypothetical protein
MVSLFFIKKKKNLWNFHGLGVCNYKTLFFFWGAIVISSRFTLRFNKSRYPLIILSNVKFFKHLKNTFLVIIFVLFSSRYYWGIVHEWRCRKSYTLGAISCIILILNFTNMIFFILKLKTIIYRQPPNDI